MVQEIFPHRLIKFTSFRVPDISTKEEKNRAKRRVWVLVDLYNNTLAKIITMNNGSQAPHREEMKGHVTVVAATSRSISEEDTALPKSLTRGSFNLRSHATQIDSILQRKMLFSNHLDLGLSNQYFTELCTIKYVDHRKTSPRIKLF